MEQGIKKKIIIAVVIFGIICIVSALRKPIVSLFHQVVKRNVDPFKTIEVTFEGIQPYATAKLNKEEEEITSGVTVSYLLSKESGLKNGDTVTVSCVYNEEVLKEHGYKIEEAEKAYEVTGLSEAYISKIDEISDSLFSDLQSACTRKIEDMGSVSYYPELLAELKTGQLENTDQFKVIKDVDYNLANVAVYLRKEPSQADYTNLIVLTYFINIGYSDSQNGPENFANIYFGYYYPNVKSKDGVIEIDPKNAYIIAKALDYGTYETKINEQLRNAEMYTKDELTFDVSAAEATEVSQQEQPQEQPQQQEWSSDPTPTPDIPMQEPQTISIEEKIASGTKMVVPIQNIANGSVVVPNEGEVTVPYKPYSIGEYLKGSDGKSYMVVDSIELSNQENLDPDELYYYLEECGSNPGLALKCDNCDGETRVFAFGPEENNTCKVCNVMPDLLPITTSGTSSYLIDDEAKVFLYTYEDTDLEKGSEFTKEDLISIPFGETNAYYKDHTMFYFAEGMLAELTIYNDKIVYFQQMEN